MAFEIDFMMARDNESILVEMRRVAKKLGKKTLTWGDINRHARMTGETVRNRFGSMRIAHEKAGLIPPPRTLADDEVLKLLVELWKTTHKNSGRSPMIRELKTSGLPISINTVLRRFGTWNKALAAAAAAAPGKLKAKARPAPEWQQRPSISVTMYFRVFKRDGYTCQICGRAGGKLELDHRIPVSRGGSDRFDNLQTLCRRCNRGKSDNLQ